MNTQRLRLFGNVSIQTRMLLIIVPLIVVPMLILAIVGFLAASGEAAKTSVRYLKQRENDLRTIAENPNTPSEVLARLASHPYEAVRQNIARHSRATGETLDKLASESNGDLWLLVACNEFAPPELRERLRARVLPETSAAAAEC